MLAVIFANGEFAEPPDLRSLLARADLIVAVDGGAQHSDRLGIQPHVLIGDLDSVSGALRSELETKGVRVLAFPPRKDQTDLELALVHAAESGADEIVVLAGLGRRWDHSFANLLLAAQPQFANLRVSFIQASQRLHILRGENELDAKLGERVSLISINADAIGVTTTGLEYPLKDETLHFGSSRGVSNVVLTENPRVIVTTGVLLCVISPPDLD